MTGKRRRMLPHCALLALCICASAQAETVLNRGNGSEPKSLDPAFVNTVAESNILGDLLTGLTTPDAAGRPIPGAAERWRCRRTAGPGPSTCARRAGRMERR